MHRKFITLIVSAAMAVTLIGTAPARAAEAEDIAKVIAGLAALAFIAKAIDDNRDDDDDDRRYVSRRVETPQPAPRARPLPPAAKRRALPGACLRTGDTHDRGFRYFGRPCLEKRWGNTARLPQACARQVRKDGTYWVGYGARCLRSKGYTAALR